MDNNRFKKTKTTTVKVLLLCVCATSLVVACGDVKKNRSHQSSFNDSELVRHYESAVWTSKLAKINKLGVTKMLCFLHNSNNNAYCYLGSNWYKNNKTIQYNITGDYDFRNDVGFRDSPLYLKTVHSNGTISNDCSSITDDSRIFLNSVGKSWLSVYLKGSLLGSELPYGGEAVFVHNHGDTPDTGTIKLMDKVFINILSNAKEVSTAESICHMSVF